MANDVPFLAKKKESKGEASCETAAGVGEFFQNRLDLTAHLLVGLGPNNKVEFSITGNDNDLSKLLYVLLKMAPPTVIRNIMKVEVAKGMQDILDNF